MSLAQWLFLAVPLPFVGVGGWLCWLGVKTLSGAAGGVRARAHAAVSEPVSPGAVDEGPAIVTGEVEATGATLTASFSVNDTVAYRYGIQKQTLDVGWWDVAEGTVSNVFTVQRDRACARSPSTLGWSRWVNCLPRGHPRRPKPHPGQRRVRPGAATGLSRGGGKSSNACSTGSPVVYHREEVTSPFPGDGVPARALR